MNIGAFAPNVTYASTVAVEPIKVLVVDDSAFMRKMITDILTSDATINVVGQARDGADALAKVALLRPDVVTMDIEMPVMDGITALTEMLRRNPVPVVMLSSLTQQGAEATLRCLEIGAVDFVSKPSGSISLDIKIVEAELIAKVKAASVARFGRSAVLSVRPTAPIELAARHKFSVIVIGSSTGGPRALQQIIPNIPVSIGVPIVIIQHMPPGFTASLAQRLQQSSSFIVKEAENGDRLTVGTILVAPGGRHLIFENGGIARLSDEPPIHGVRPAVDITMSSLAHLYGSNILGVILTGMGKDGARALKQVSDNGGLTLAEDETTCVVYGMPKAAFELGGVQNLLPLQEIAPAISQACKVSL
jgi:two-component system chemotaxis response regulator CheB